MPGGMLRIEAPRQNVHRPKKASEHRNDEAPHRRYVVGFLAFEAILCIQSVRGLLAGNHTQSYFLLACAAVLVLVAFVVGRVFMSTVIHSSGKAHLSASEKKALHADPGGALAQQAERVLRYGTHLGRPAQEQRGAKLEHAGDEETLKLIETARVQELGQTSEWLEGIVAPRIETITAQDQAILTAHVFECALDSNRWAVLVHGYGGSWTDTMLYARHYASYGFNLLIPEMRAHGASGGSRPGLGWLDRTDLVDWCRWIATFEDEGARIVLHGQGLGATAVCVAASEKTLPSGVVACVADSPYSDAWNASARILRTRGLPPHPVLDVIRVIFKILPGGFDLTRASARDAVVHAQVPLLLFAGERDCYALPHLVKSIYDSASGGAAQDNKRLRMFPRAGHVEAALVDPQTYYHELMDFLKMRL
ncbi:MAG: alpha/beta hydrolase [Atopobiaceae bacterium]